MKPNEGRKRVVIEEVQPTVNAGRYAAKRVVGDEVIVTAAIFGDGHDHRLGARLLFRHSSERTWQAQSSTFRELGNDLWSASFTVDRIGLWYFAVEAWIDHFNTWLSDLDKRLAAQQASGAGHPARTQHRRQPPRHHRHPRSRRREKDPQGSRAPNYATSPPPTFPSTKAPPRPRSSSPRSSPSQRSIPTFPSPPAHPANSLSGSIANARSTPHGTSSSRASASPIPGEHGTLLDVEARLPEIAAMGFDVLYMPPIHPIGTAFRKGKNNSVTAEPGDVGSPWAMGAAEGGHTEILPALGNFNDFDSLLRAAKHNGMELALDIAFQCSPDHPWVKAHPAWFIQRPDGAHHSLRRKSSKNISGHLPA